MAGMVAEAHGQHVRVQQSFCVASSSPGDEKIGNVEGCCFRRDRAESARTLFLVRIENLICAAEQIEVRQSPSGEYSTYFLHGEAIPKIPPLVEAARHEIA